MKILVADDDPISLQVLVRNLELMGHEVIQAKDGGEAWEVLNHPETPLLAILDWNMPVLLGTQLCQRVRTLDLTYPPYLIILTSRGSITDIIEGLDSGADAFLTKPLDPKELKARITAGQRLMDVQNALVTQNIQLKEVRDQVKTLEGIIPICAYCHKIKNGLQDWAKIEQYISEHTTAIFSHGICPECYREPLKK